MFNAIKYSQELEKAGFTRDQAEASVKLLIDAMNENFATRSDIQETHIKIDSVKDELNLKIDSVKDELNLKIDSVKKELDTSIFTVKKDLESSILIQEQKMNHKFDQFGASLRELEYKMTIKLGTMMTLAIGVTATVVKMIQGMR